MERDPITVDADMPIHDVQRLMDEQGRWAVPVLEAGMYRGIFTGDRFLHIYRQLSPDPARSIRSCSIAGPWPASGRNSGFGHGSRFSAVTLIRYAQSSTITTYSATLPLRSHVHLQDGHESFFSRRIWRPGNGRSGQELWTRPDVDRGCLQASSVPMPYLEQLIGPLRRAGSCRARAARVAAIS